MNKKKSSRKVRSNKLNRRQRQGKKLLSPYSKLGDVVNWSSWSNNHLLNILWACVLAGSLEKDHYLDLFSRISIEGRSELKDVDNASLCHNFLSTIEQATFDQVFSPLVADSRAGQIAQCLTLIDGLPDIEHWRRLFPESEPSPELWETLAKGVFSCLDHQSQEATDVRWLKVIFLAICGKLILPRSPDSLAETGLMKELRLYPNHGDMVKVRPMIRSLEMTIRSMEVGQEKGEHIPGFESEIVWAELFQKTECRLGKPDNPVPEDRKALANELETTIDQVIDYFLSETSNSSIDARMDASFGIALYSLTLTYELAYSPGQIFSSGRILLRTIAECFITLAFLSAKDDPTIWEQYRNYGTGQTILAFLKASVFDDIPDYIDIKKLEMLANEDAWMETRDINLGAWTNKNLRSMSEEAGVKAVYDTYYDWPSGFVHGNWGSVRDSVFTTCLNPLHRFHRVPCPMRPMPSVLNDCCTLCNQILDTLNVLYPVFNTRIQSHNN